MTIASVDRGLGDPRTLILDEPVNGLDPEGIDAAHDASILRELWARNRVVKNDD
jgi:ABC-type multidrug transport system ATPase subunit